MLVNLFLATFSGLSASSLSASVSLSRSVTDDNLWTRYRTDTEFEEIYIVTQTTSQITISRRRQPLDTIQNAHRVRRDLHHHTDCITHHDQSPTTTSGHDTERTQSSKRSTSSQKLHHTSRSVTVDNLWTRHRTDTEFEEIYIITLSLIHI